ncbi:Endoglucanase-4 [Arthrobotrys entomopaga]|nr:Endoglucanase-4 [Arthrobotrys entomopaga]
MVAFSKVAAVAALASSASAHTIFQKLYVNGVDQGQGVGIRVPSTNNPVLDVSTIDIVCNTGLKSPGPSAIINTPAGATLTMEWHHGGNGPDPSDGDDPVASSHKGPIMVYLAKVDNALTASASGLKWFKIYEDGLDATSGTWAVDKFIAADGKVNFSIPTCLAPGNYLLRGELIALHGAGNYPGAQFYMSCAQINITGGGSASPPTVSFPGAYSGSDPGILVNIYYPPLSKYIIPGPRPYTCGGGSNPTTAKTTAAPTTKATTTLVTTTKATTTAVTTARTTTTTTTKPTTKATTTGGGSSGGAPLYGQCGGAGWTGPTTCAQGTCTYSNAYYSQCL